jgi:hypothetical protein
MHALHQPFCEDGNTFPLLCMQNEAVSASDSCQPFRLHHTWHLRLNLHAGSVAVCCCEAYHIQGRCCCQSCLMLALLGWAFVICTTGAGHLGPRLLLVHYSLWRVPFSGESIHLAPPTHTQCKSLYAFSKIVTVPCPPGQCWGQHDCNHCY